MRDNRILSIVTATVLVLATVPFYVGIGGLSLMAFDSPGAWTFVAIVESLCILIPLLSLIVSIRMLRKNRLIGGLVTSVIPAITLGIFWLWLSQQSFS